MDDLKLQPALLTRWREILTPEAFALLTANNLPRITGLRLNPLKAAPEVTLESFRQIGIALTPVAHVEHGYTTHATVRQLQEHPAHAHGAFHIQSASSMTASAALAPEPGDAVLDLCAAPGSKTSHLAAMMKNCGRLVAVDSSRPRVYRLREVLRVLGAQADCICAQGQRWARGNPACFDRVLVDAPCSGEGRIHSGDHAAHEDWSLAKVRRLASLQKSLLHAGIDALRPGGTLIFSTCTFAPEENELVLQRALELYRDQIRVVPIPLNIPDSVPALSSWQGDSLDPSIANARRIQPPSEGFFIAKLLKASR